MKLVIVGGVAGGASAAVRARRLSETAEITLFERGPDVSFANCGLPYHIGEVIEHRQKLLVTTPEKLRERFRLNVRTLTSVEAIDRAAKTVKVRDLSSGQTTTQPYDKLILAPGAAPIHPNWQGTTYTLRNLPDMDCIKQVVDSGIKRAVIIGAGFIGLELAENLVHRGVETTIIELQDQILPPLDKEMTTPLAQLLRSKGVQLLLGDAVEAVTAVGNELQVILKSGTQIKTQLVVVGVGVRPENQLAVAAGLEVGPRGGVRVNAEMQTSDPDIFAVGDVIEVTDAVLEQPTQVPLAGPANRQGRIAADNVFGRHSTYRGTQGSAILGLFDHTAAMTGASEKTLRRTGRAFRAVYLHPADHAGYYPGAASMTLKVLFDPANGQILGAQGVGTRGVDKRIDVLSMAIQAKLTVYDLEQAELCYSPQFGSAKDPINMAGFIASNLLRGDHPQIDWSTWNALPPGARPLLVDVRTPEEFAQGAIPGAINLPVDNLRENLNQIPADREVVVYCQVGQRGYLATRILMQAGRQVRNLSGGYRTYLLWQ